MGITEKTKSATFQTRQRGAGEGGGRRFPSGTFANFYVFGQMTHPKELFGPKSTLEPITIFQVYMKGILTDCVKSYKIHHASEHGVVHSFNQPNATVSQEHLPSLLVNKRK